MTDETTRDPSKVARDAALQSLVSNVVYLALMLGVTVAITKRDALIRLRMRLAHQIRNDAAKSAHRKAINDFRRELSQIEHWLNRKPSRGPESDSEPRDTPGGLYGQG